MRALSIVGLTAAFLARCGQDTASTANHIAPIAAGAIPEQIGGCDKGCEKSNRFLQWQSYLAPLVEIHRKQSKCASVEWVTVDIDSDPDNPQFYVTCKKTWGICTTRSIQRVRSTLEKLQAANLYPELKQ